jgi:hypothetical protein
MKIHMKLNKGIAGRSAYECRARRGRNRRRERLAITGVLGVLLTASIAVPVVAQPSVDCTVETTTADFQAGALTGTMVTEVDNGANSGQFRLAAPLNDLFLSPTLGSQWVTTQPAGGYTPSIVDGVLDVQEQDSGTFPTSALHTVAQYSAGVTLEFRAFFETGSAFTTGGLVNNSAVPTQWIWFTTANTGGSAGSAILYASVRTSAGSTNIETSVTFGEWHEFKIVWTPGAAEFWVDGVSVASHSGFTITPLLRAGFLKQPGADSSLLVDWVRLTPYAGSPGTYESVVYDAGSPGATWLALQSTVQEPTGTSVAFATRTGETAVPDGTWSGWEAIVGTGVASPVGRYAQYQATLTSGDLAVSPVVDEVQLCYTVADVTPPAAIAQLGASQVLTGNPAGETTLVEVTWEPVESGATVDVYRKGYGNYPEYDDGPGAGQMPTVPASVTAALAEGWVLAGSVVGTEQYADLAPSRDYWSYVAFVSDDQGNVSGPSNLESSLNYHLGDVSDGVTAGTGDNVVGSADISLLGTSYGLSEGDPGYLNVLDIGPTADLSPHSLPVTDSVIEFEDLMLFGINYGQVGKFAEAPAPLAANRVQLESGSSPELGEPYVVRVVMEGDGRLQGLRVPVSWDRGVLDLQEVVGGDLLAAQGGLSFVGTASPGVVDAALIGRRSQGIGGRGVLAELRFVVRAAGDPGLGLGTIAGRTAANEPVTLTGEVAPVLPLQTVLHANSPNPFNPRTTISFELATGGRVRLLVYGVDGRLVRTLAAEDLPAGRHDRTWNGTDDTGRRVASGTYLLRLETAGGAQSRKMMLLK